MGFNSCKKDLPYFKDTGYPAEINNIIFKSCAVDGCHVNNSKDAAGGLSMQTWTDLFKGGRGGSTVIPFRPDYSWLMYYTNTDTTLGIALTPTMPANQPPLSRSDYLILYNWILQGAPDCNGNIAFKDNAERSKFYITNQGCDVVTVFDTKSLLAMRYIDVGHTSSIEVPHDIKTSPDGKYWYAIFAASDVIQKFNTSDDSYIGEATIGNGSWNTITISDDGHYAFIVDWENQGRIAYVDLNTMALIKMYQGTGLFAWPHGICATHDFKTLYVTAQYGNFIYKIDVSNPLVPDIQTVVLQPGQPATSTSGVLDPHVIDLTPDESRYLVTCESSNEVRVFQTSNDSLLAIIPVGSFPLELEYSDLQPLAFVTCENDPCSQPHCEGSVYVINYQTMNVVKVIQDGLYQPHGIAVDDEHGYLYVPSRNLDVSGPAPHHLGNCGGRNGFLKIVDLNTLDFIPNYKIELSVDPYEVAVRNGN